MPECKAKTLPQRNRKRVVGLRKMLRRANVPKNDSAAASSVAEESSKIVPLFMLYLIKNSVAMAHQY